MRTVLVLLVFGIFASVFLVRGHEQEYGDPCDPMEDGEGDHNHSAVCNPGLNLECVENECVCKKDYKYVEGTGGCSGASSMAVSAFAFVISAVAARWVAR